MLDVRVDRAGNGLAEHDAVQAAQAADAGADLLGAARSGLVAELGVAQVGAAHHADVGGAVLDELLGDPGLVDTAHGGHGDGHVLLDLTRESGMAGLLGVRSAMVVERVGHIAVVGKVGGHGRHEHAVLDLLRATLMGLNSIG